MSTIDLSKYAGSFSLEEAKEISKRIETDIFEAKKKVDLEEARQIYGDDRTYELRLGTRINLQALKPNESVCASQIKGYHILMTEKPTLMTIPDIVKELSDQWKELAKNEAEDSIKNRLHQNDPNVWQLKNLMLCDEGDKYTLCVYLMLHENTYNAAHRVDYTISREQYLTLKDHLKI